MSIIEVTYQCDLCERHGPESEMCGFELLGGNNRAITSTPQPGQRHICRDCIKMIAGTDIAKAAQSRDI